MYRKPNELVLDFHKFQHEFDETLECLRVNRIPVYLCGDFNIDLLKLNVKDPYKTHFNNLIAAGKFLTYKFTKPESLIIVLPSWTIYLASN